MEYIAGEKIDKGDLVCLHLDGHLYKARHEINCRVQSRREMALIYDGVAGRVANFYKVAKSQTRVGIGRWKRH